MSSLIAIYHFFHFLLFIILCNTSKVIVVLSVICLPGTKTLWASDITFGKITFNLFAKTLETILDTTFSKLIGQTYIVVHSF